MTDTIETPLRHRRADMEPTRQNTAQQVAVEVQQVDEAQTTAVLTPTRQEKRCADHGGRSRRRTLIV